MYTTVEIFVVDFDDQGAKFDKYTYYATVEEGFHNVSIALETRGELWDVDIVTKGI